MRIWVMVRFLTRSLVVFVPVLLWPLSAAAQIYESVGVRAQGMGGAFVAVADDATASWWNPAGIASGALFNLTAERTVSTLADGLLPQGPTSRSGVTGVAVGIPSLVVSFYHIRINEIAPDSVPTDEEGTDRNNGEPFPARLQATALRQYGATFGQSFGSHLVLASTVRLIRGGVTRAADPASQGGLDVVSDLEVPSHTSGTLDLGVILGVGVLRAGASVKNVYEPDLGEGDERLVLERQARAGIAFLLGNRDGLTTAVLSADADLLTVRTLGRDVRHVASGLELWLGGRRIGLRGGFSANTADDVETSWSAGTTVGFGTSGLYVDGAATFGDDESRTGWAVGLGMTF
jgi:hypothetical protein